MASATSMPEHEAVFKAMEQPPRPVLDASQSSSSSSSSLSSSSTSSTITNVLSAPFDALSSAKGRFDSWRNGLGYASPGPYESFGKELKYLQTTPFMFDGAKAELSKSVSMNPAFQVSHSFALGGMAGPTVNPGTYNFAGVWGSDYTLMQGSLDNDGSVSGRCNLAWDEAKTLVSKMQAQLSPSPAAPSMFIFEQDYTGPDYALNLKALNPGLTDGSGTYILGGMIAVSPRIALGVETILQRQYGVQESAHGLKAKYTSANKDWLATVEVTAQKAVSLGYWQRLAERVEAGAELALAPALAPQERKAVATVGCKYDYRLATFRGQVDSQGKVQAFFEQRINPMMAFLLSGEIDHWKNTSKFGVGVMVESSQMDEAALTTAIPARPPV